MYTHIIGTRPRRRVSTAPTTRARSSADGKATRCPEHNNITDNNDNDEERICINMIVIVTVNICCWTSGSRRGHVQPALRAARDAAARCVL